MKLYVDGTLETISTSTAFALNTTASGNAKIGADIQELVTYEATPTVSTEGRLFFRLRVLLPF